MKALVCEMCNSNDLLKVDGVYVCQNCGTKYSVEDAKRMMVEGTVDVQGTVKVDNSAFVEKYLANARRAKEKEDWEETEKYYNLVEQNDPTNIEAIFYSSYGKAKQSLIEGDLYKRKAVFNVLNKCVSIIDDNYDIKKDYDEQIAIVRQIASDLIGLFGSSYVYNIKKNGYGVETWNDKAETVALFTTVCASYCDTVVNIAMKYQGDEKSIGYYKISIIMAEYAMKNLNVNRQSFIKVIVGLHNEIKKIDSSYEIPSYEEISKANPSNSSGCYVATCVYGSYDCPQVWTLRRYRDYKLDATWHGRAFIKTYYAISPTIVKWFGNTNWFKKLWKGKLDKMVAKLQKQGYENTRYNDKY